MTEASAPGDGPPQMVGVTSAWEAAAADARANRQVVLRTSIVLDRDTPALRRLAGLARYGLGGRVGSGQQWFSWIHITDWLRIVHWCLGLQADAAGGPNVALPVAPSPHGVLVATSPNPVRNEELMRTLRGVLHRPPAPPTPEFVVRLGSMLLRSDPALGLTGRRAVSARLREAGFVFQHPELEGALGNLLRAR